MTSNSDCSKSKTCDWWSSSARRSAIPIRNAKQSTRNSSRPGSTKKQGATRPLSKRFSGNSLPTTRLRQQGGPDLNKVEAELAAICESAWQRYEFGTSALIVG